MERLFLINTGLQTGVRSYRNEKTVSTVLARKEAVEIEAASTLLWANTRLKPGVNGRATCTSGVN
jgi:hypothetical protein